MIIRDDSAKNEDLHNPNKAKNKGEEIQVDLGQPLTEVEGKIFAKLKEGLHL